MPKIALVEDEAEAADVLASFIDRYGAEKGVGFTIVRFCNAIDFELTHQKFDLVFMDIQMPGIDGMEAAHLMRTYDSETPIIFVTNLAQYAVKGYEVDALDFIVKPVSYYNFRMRMDKAMRRIARAGGRSVVINTRDGLRVVSVSDIEYVEVSKHDLSYRLVGEEEPLVVYGSLKTFEEEVEGGPFVRISNSCLVNMNQIRSVRGGSLRTHRGEELFFSRSRKREAVATIAAFLGGSI